MKKRNKNIFEPGLERKRKKDNIKGIKNISKNSGYLHDWKEVRTERRSKRLKLLGIFAAMFIVSVSVTIFINTQNFRQIRQQQEQFLAEMTPAPTQMIEHATLEPIEYSDDFHRALKQYQDVIGYLTIADTGIDFPIVQGEDNYFFENRNYDRSYSEIAATYMLTECNPTTSRHLVIYGENEDIEDRFGDLNEFLDYEFFIAHEFITFELEDGARVWQVFSVHLSSVNFDYKDVYFESNTEYLAYIKMFRTMSRFDRSVGLTEKDQIVTLVTDYYDLDLAEGYLMIHARRIN